MVNLKKLEGTDIYEFSIMGKIDEVSMKKMFAFLEEKTNNREPIKLLGTIDEFPSFKDFKAFTQTLKMKSKAINGICRYALLSDKDWIETIMPIGNFVTPGIPIKHFELDERNKAIAWLSKDEDKAFLAKNYLSKMDIQHVKGTNIYKFTVDGKIDEGGMSALYSILKDRTKDEKVNLLAFFKDFDGFQNFKALVEGIKIDFAAFGNINKYAIITDKKWVKTLAEIESKILPGITIKSFSENEEELAMTWLKEA